MSCVNQRTYHRDVAPIAIRCLDEADAPAFRMLRLDALREFPASFGITDAEERANSWPDYSIYGSLGLQPFGRERQARKMHDGFVALELMALYLR